MNQILLIALAIVTFYNSSSYATDLRDQWTKVNPAFKVQEGAEKFAPSSTIKAEKVTLKNSGGIVTKVSFEDSVDVSLTWGRTPQDTDGGDQLRINILTDGEQVEKRPSEVKKGIVIRFEATHGNVVALTRDGDKQSSIAAVNNVIYQPGKNKLRARLMNGQLFVWVNGLQVIGDEPIPEDFKPRRHKISIHNRWPYSGSVKVTTLTELKFRAFKDE